MNEAPPTPHPHVVLRDGSPFVVGSGVPVRRIWRWYKKGVPVLTLVRRYPALGWAKVLDALSFCFDNKELMEADLKKDEPASEEPDPRQLELFGGDKSSASGGSP